jgi:hypothetical protein
MATDPRFADHHPMEVRHGDELEWEMIRWPGETGKMIFHPRQEPFSEAQFKALKYRPAFPERFGSIQAALGAVHRASHRAAG